MREQGKKTVTCKQAIEKEGCRRTVDEKKRRPNERIKKRVREKGGRKMDIKWR
jgi:hypothetical protein